LFEAICIRKEQKLDRQSGVVKEPQPHAKITKNYGLHIDCSCVYLPLFILPFKLCSEQVGVQGGLPAHGNETPS